jgi:hypothetical protein
MQRYIFLVAILFVTIAGFTQTNVTNENATSPKAIVGGYFNGDSVLKNAFAAQAGVAVYWLNEHISGTSYETLSQNYRYSVTFFQIIVIRNGATMFSNDNNGNAFNSKTKSYLNSLEPGDIIVISGIKAVRGEADSKANPVELTLKPLLYIIK